MADKTASYRKKIENVIIYFRFLIIAGKETEKASLRELNRLHGVHSSLTRKYHSNDTNDTKSITSFFVNIEKTIYGGGKS